MSATLLDSINELLTPDFINKAATALGDSGPAVSKSMDALVPLLLGGTAKRAADPGFAGTLLNLLREPANDGSLLSNPSSLLVAGGGNSAIVALGGKLLSMLFGGNQNRLVSALSGYAGVKPETATSLLNVAAPIVLSVLGKAVKSGNLNASSLTNLLTSQASECTSRLPAALSSLDTFLARDHVHVNNMTTPPPAKPQSSIWRWLLPLLLALLALWLIPQFLGPEEETVEVVLPPPPAATMPETLPVEQPPALETAPTAKPAANLYFEVGKFNLPADASDTLAPVVAYLQADSEAIVSVSGYHDTSGDGATNEELAKNRAMAVRDALLTAGVADAQIELREPITNSVGGAAEDGRRVELKVE